MMLSYSLIIAVLGLISLLGFVKADTVQELKDGQIVDITFTETNYSLMFSYQAIDPSADILITVYPTDGVEGVVYTHFQLSPTAGVRSFHSEIGYFTYQMSAYDDYRYGYDFVSGPLYLQVKGTSGTKASIFVISSIYVSNEETITINTKDKNDTYDWAAHNYIRYYRIFACDDDDNPSNPGAITLSGSAPNNGYIKTNINFWNSDRGDSPGRPTSSSSNFSSQATFIKITSIDGFVYPGYVFIGIDATVLFTDTTLSDSYYSFTLTPSLEDPETFITKDNEYTTDLCFYEDCYEFATFDPNEFVLDSEGNALTLDNLYFLVMYSDKFIHESQGLLTLEAMTSTYYDSTNKIHKYGYDNFIEFTSDEIGLMQGNDITQMFVAITTTNMTRYMQNIEGVSSSNPYLNVTSTLIKNTKPVMAGDSKTTVQLKLGTDWENECVYYYRLILDTAGIENVEYLVPENDDGTKKETISVDYYVNIGSSTDTSKNATIYGGAYIGNGYAKVPNYTVDTDGTHTTNNNYIFLSTTLAKNESEGLNYDSQILKINHDSSEFYQDGAYILDIIDTNCNTSNTSETGADVDVFAQPSWNISTNEEYYKTLNGKTTYDYFTVEISDISYGATIYAELINAVEGDSSVGIYVSFINPLPNDSSELNSSGYYYASYTITKDVFEQYSSYTSAGQYTVYFAINTSHTGDMKLIVSEGVGSLIHIGPGGSQDVDVILNDEMSVVMFHSSQNVIQNSLVVYLEGVGTWADNVTLQACIYNELQTSYTNCSSRSGKYIRLSSKSNKGTINFEIPTGSTAHPDYFLHIIAKTVGTATTTSVRVKVFGDDYDDLTSSDELTYTVNYRMDPIMLKVLTLSGMDYTLLLNFISKPLSNARLTARICAKYPAISSTSPSDVGSDNVRNCTTQVLYGDDGLKIDIVGDIILNNSTGSNDLSYILSEVKYITIFPDKSSVAASISAELYEDTHVRANTSLTVLTGAYQDLSYFRLLISGEDSSNAGDLLSIDFQGAYPIYYCMSTEPHTDIFSDSCIISSTEYTKQSSYKFINTVKLTDINKNYAASNEVYVYFTYVFPEGTETNVNTRKIKFSNTVIHYLPLIASDSDDIDTDTYYFELSSGKRMAFYTDKFNYGTPFRFFIVPDVTDTISLTNVDNTGSYSTTTVAIKKTTDYTAILPTPTNNNADKVGAGILVYDCTTDSSVGPDGSKYTAIAVQFAETSSKNTPYGLYKAGFLDLSGNVTGNLVKMTEITPGQTYNYIYDHTSSKLPSTQPKSEIFHYPYAKSEIVMKVYPCAGIPAMYSSFLTTNPKGEDKAYTTSYPMMGHTRGTSYTVNFFNNLDNGEDQEITLPTGYIFNATFERGWYLEENDPENKTRWDADFQLITGSGSNAYGGPRVTTTDVKVSSQREAELVIEFSEALSGYQSDPSITSTHIEYAVFAMPAPEEGYENPNYDASPMTYCGMNKYGFPLTVDDDNNVKWTVGNSSSNADGSGSNTINSKMKLTTNFIPSKYKYESGVIVNLDGTTNKDTSRYNINVIAREIHDNGSSETTILGYSAYKSILVNISGGLPVTPGGLFAWEIAIIVIVVLAVVGIAIGVTIVCIKKKKQAMGYGNLDGYGNTGKQGLNVDLPDDDLSISASTSSPRNIEN